MGILLFFFFFSFNFIIKFSALYMVTTDTHINNLFLVGLFLLMRMLA